jgi:hypothetical protein
VGKQYHPYDMQIEFHRRFEIESQVVVSLFRSAGDLQSHHEFLEQEYEHSPVLLDSMDQEANQFSMQ